MAYVIHKVQLDIVDEQALPLPADANVLHVGMERDQLFIWYRTANPNGPSMPRRFRICGTGHECPGPQELYVYLSTVPQGVYVWHVFERLNLQEQDA